MSSIIDDGVSNGQANERKGDQPEGGEADRPDDSAVDADAGGQGDQVSATRSISTSAPLGSSATATVERAGLEVPKYSA